MLTARRDSPYWISSAKGSSRSSDKHSNDEPMDSQSSKGSSKESTHSDDIFEEREDDDSCGWTAEACDVSWGPDSDEESEGEEQLVSHLYFGLVQSLDGETSPFSEAGDSGSLVYLRRDGIIVPLGIHVGITDAYGEPCSFFISVDRWFSEAKKHGLSLRFQSN